MALEDLALEDMVAVTATWTDRSHSDYQALAKRPITNALLPDIDEAHQAVMRALQERAQKTQEVHAGSAEGSPDHAARAQWLRMMLTVRTVAEVVAADDMRLQDMLHRADAAGERVEERSAPIPMGPMGPMGWRSGTDPGILRAPGTRIRVRPRPLAASQASSSG